LQPDCSDPELEQVLEDIRSLLQQNLPFDDFRRLYAAQMHLTRRGPSDLLKTKKFLTDAAKGKRNLSIHCLLLLGLLEAYEINLDASLYSLREAVVLAEQRQHRELIDKAQELVETIAERKQIFDLYSTALDTAEETQRKESIRNLALREACQYLLVARRIIKRSENKI
jgi:exonuclease VII small subunit